MITAGVISSFLFYILTLIWNIMIITHVWMNVSQVVGASDKLITIMNHKPKINTEGGVKIQDCSDIRGVIELRNVKFHYPSK